MFDPGGAVVNRAQLEHVIGAAATIADDDEIVVVGSQSILGQFPDAPAELCRSMEADLWPRNHPDRWELVDGSIGELSPFHETFGYYGQGVGEETVVLPAGWQDRLVRVASPATRGAVGLCLEVHDLVISKLVAEREKDLEFVRAVIAHRLVREETLRERLETAPVPAERRRRIAGLIARAFAD
ncbi:MAG TPA: DUF6036 family nucleotidyltransferase [Methylomirabilota bacterium]|nr:DUF6036 family nucleotidyltransferase [Methylomirabilota bacterium]